MDFFSEIQELKHAIAGTYDMKALCDLDIEKTSYFWINT